MRNMKGTKFLGLCVPVINVVYSVFYGAIACRFMDESSSSSIILRTLFFFYIILNLAIFIRILKKDIVDYAAYSFCAAALCLTRMSLQGYTKEKGKREVYYIVTDVYILLSIAIMLVVFLSIKKPTPEFAYFQTRPIRIEPERIQLKSTQAPSCDRTLKPPLKQSIVQYTAPKEVVVLVVEAYTATLSSTSTSLEDIPSSHMTKSSPNDNHRPDEPRPFGWNIEGGSAFTPARPQRSEATDPPSQIICTQCTCI